MQIKKVYNSPSVITIPANDDYVRNLRLFRENSLDNNHEQNEVAQAIRPVVMWGILITSFIIAFFGIWAGFAPLESAAIAKGKVELNSNKKTIVHLEGGIIRELLVKEGDAVQKGQTLLTLNAAGASTQQQLLQDKLNMAVATEIRLLSERDDQYILNYDEAFPTVNRTDKINELIKNQQRLFQTRRAAILGKIDILQERIMQYNDQIAGLNEQTLEVKNQSNLIAEEVRSVSYLVDKGIEQKPKLLSLKRKQSELNGLVAKYTSEIATIQGSISEMQLQMIIVQNEYLKDIMTEIKDVQQEVADLKEKLNISGDILDRTVITAPISGIITSLDYQTIGSFITPGSKIMEISPPNDNLSIEALIRQEDINLVYEGLDAKVILSAYKSGFLPRLNGKVTNLSTDRFTDKATDQSYYLTTVEINGSELKDLPDDIKLYSGMQAELFIKTGESTLIKYLTSPIIDSFRRSFREQ
jgi:HlyD family type I secretion membrane fusion protein